MRKYYINSNKFLKSDACEKVLSLFRKKYRSVPDLYDNNKNFFHNRLLDLEAVKYMYKTINAGKPTKFLHLKFFWELSGGEDAEEHLLNKKALKNPIAEIQKSLFVSGLTMKELSKGLDVTENDLRGILAREDLFLKVTKLLGIKKYERF